MLHAYLVHNSLYLRTWYENSTLLHMPIYSHTTSSSATRLLLREGHSNDQHTHICVHVHNQLSIGLTTTVAQQTTHIPKQIVGAPVPSMQSLEVHSAERGLTYLSRLKKSCASTLCSRSACTCRSSLWLLGSTRAETFCNRAGLFHCAHTQTDTHVSRRRAEVKG